MQATEQIVSKLLSQIKERSTSSEERDLREPLKGLWTDALKPFQTRQDPTLERMVAAATDFLRDVVSRQQPRWLSYLGPSGTGKTMLATILYRFLKQHCLRVTPGYGITLTEQSYLAKWPRVVQEMKHGSFETPELLCEFEDKYDGSRGPTYLYAFIDDIGQVEDSAKTYVLMNLGKIADYRLRTWTIWTANMGLSEIGDRLDRRIASRMIRGENVVIEQPHDFPDYNLR